MPRFSIQVIKDLGSSIHVLVENSVLRDSRPHKGNTAAEMGFFFYFFFLMAMMFNLDLADQLPY